MLKRKLDTMRTFVGTLSLCGLLALPGIALAESAYVLGEGTPQTIGGESTKTDFTKDDFATPDGATDSFSIVSGSVNNGSVNFDGEVTGTVDPSETKKNLYGVRLTGTDKAGSKVTIVNGSLKLTNGSGSTCGVVSEQADTTVKLSKNTAITADTGAELSGDNAKVDNNGTITATTGAELSGDNSEFNNYGTVTASDVGVRMTGDDAYFYNGENCNITADGSAETSVGVVIQKGDENQTSTNNGTISGFATGIEMGDGKVENLGQITDAKIGIKADSGTVSNIKNSGSCGTIKAETGIEMGSGTVENSGQITATDVGIKVASQGYITNEGSISASQTGIEMVKGEAINSGAITDAKVGIKVNATTGSNSVTNKSAGTISASETGIDVGSGNVINDGTISNAKTGIKVASGTARNYSSISADTGIEIESGQASNSGEIAAKIGILATGNVDVKNTGTITSSEACIRVDAGNKSVTITNTGQLLTTGNGYEMRIASGTATLAEGYTLTLDGTPTTPSILVDNGATLDLANTPLKVEGTKYETDYTVFGMDGTAAINGKWGTMSTPNPNYVVTYTKGDSRADDTVRLDYKPEQSSSNVSAEVAELSVMNAVNVVQNRMATNAMMQSLAQTMLAENESPVMVADARTTATDIGGGVLPEDKGNHDVFAMPYGSWSKSTRSPMGYEATVGGLTLGWEYQNDNTVLGIHGGYGRAGIDFNGSGYTRNSEDQDLFTLGVHAGKLWGKWLLSGSITPYLTLHDYKGMTGVNLTDREKADYESFGSVNRILGGYQFVYDDNIFMPTLGLTHIWIHRDRYTTKVTGGTGTTYNTLDDHELQANAGLRWMRNIECDGFTLVPSVYAGLRQTLTDGSTSTTQSVPGATPVTVNSKSDLTAANLEAFVSMIKGDWTFQLGYAGEMSDQNQDHGAWLRAKWAF
ncbi:autotransporter outer membrane beta-barrel domain-containing protein [Pseudodesulfovibrio tunisiensis]|uniref:autotransporter outer membrane beta-barrel domain-containing protein n=1 Tax=Pseudodesulfovibrio tunisiensis TaxID=463192 RepID=UPI001FB5335F|nr:autotransporter domain-containing protein [Pseudodesulfovibrio tunisiensis]